MNIYKIESTIFVRGETLADALSHLHEEIAYHFSQDNNLIAVETGAGELAETEEEN